MLARIEAIGGACTGEDLNVGMSQNNYLAFEVRQTSSGMGGNSSQGSLVIYWPGTPNSGNNGCSANVTWPLLTNVTVLGVSAVNPASVAVEVTHGPMFLGFHWLAVIRRCMGCMLSGHLSSCSIISFWAACLL